MGSNPIRITKNPDRVTKKPKRVTKIGQTDFYKTSVLTTGVFVSTGDGDFEDNIFGRQNDFIFEGGKHYTFTVSYYEDQQADRVDMTVEDISEGGTTSLWTTVNGITNTSYALSGLQEGTFYKVQVQTVKDGKLYHNRSLPCHLPAGAGGARRSQSLQPQLRRRYHRHNLTLLPRECARDSWR